MEGWKSTVGILIILDFTNNITKNEDGLDLYCAFYNIKFNFNKYISDEWTQCESNNILKTNRLWKYPNWMINSLRLYRSHFTVLIK